MITEIGYPTSETESSLRSVFSRHDVEVTGVLLSKGRMTVLIKRNQTFQYQDLVNALADAMNEASIAYDNQVDIRVG